MESSLRQENNTLRAQLQDLQLDLDDSKKSRRDLQHQLQAMENYVSSVTEDTQLRKV
jgi:predicted  nucleic acid-binding Zn-ribbon protein